MGSGVRVGRDHFYGQSISTLHDLAETNHYNLVALQYNNAILISGVIEGVPSLSAAEAYEQGYASRPDRSARFPWNEDMEWLQGMDGAEALAGLEGYFAGYRGRYDLSL
jgi:hypothetical protein